MTTPKRNEAVAYRVHVPDEPELGHWYEDVGETEPEFVTTETHDPLYSQATVDALERELELAHGWTGDPHLSGKTALANAHAVSDVLREQIAALQGEVSRLREDAMRYRELKRGRRQPFGDDFVVRKFNRTFGEEEPVAWSEVDRELDSRINLEPPTDGR